MPSKIPTSVLPNNTVAAVSWCDQKENRLCDQKEKNGVGGEYCVVGAAVVAKTGGASAEAKYAMP
jgi:hypothetical protein